MRMATALADLSRLLRPKSIAVIGGGWGIAVVEQCLKMGFEGTVWPVHPTRDEIHGLPCVRSVAELPAPPDAVYVAVNRHATVETIAALSDMGAGGAVCFASGFAEAEDDRAKGIALQARLVDAAGDMPIIGPNCYGLINYLDSTVLWPDQHGGTRVDRGVAILGQSSNMLINLTMQSRALPMAYVMAAGNQAQIGLATLGLAMLEDPRVTAIGLHIEGIGDLRAFEALAARARVLAKPIVALKVGRSEQARAATLSHTASLAGSEATGRAFLARIGIPVVTSLSEFLESLMLLHVHGPLPGRTLASMSCSGGEAAMIADAAQDRQVSFRALRQDEHDRIKATLGPLVTVSNPLDYHTFIWGDAQRMAETYAAMLSGGFDLAMLVYDFPRTDRCSDAAWQCGTDAIAAAAERTGARTAVVSSLPECLPEAKARTLLAAGIAPLRGLDEAMAAAEAAAAVGAAWRQPLPPPVLLAPQGATVTSGDPVLLDEATAKAKLAAHGVTVPAGRKAETAEDAAQAAHALGFPVALKALGVAHKTEAGAVRLGLNTQAEVRSAAEAMPAPNGFLVERMISGGVAELIVGVLYDAAYGFSLTIGAGGVFTELLEDRTTLMIPSDRQTVCEALSNLRVAKLLDGFRGARPASRAAILDAVMAVQSAVEAEATTLLELEINPLIVSPEAAFAADALLRVRRSDEQPC